LFWLFLNTSIISPFVITVSLSKNTLMDMHIVAIKKAKVIIKIK
jgi:hypothetical protein